MVYDFFPSTDQTDGNDKKKFWSVSLRDTK